jgi:hypothetical protein
MITIEIAKLLSENGYDKKSFAVYAKDFYGEYQLEKLINIFFDDPYDTVYMTPTYLDVEEWFLENGYYLHSYYLTDECKFGCDIYDLKSNLLYCSILHNRKQNAIDNAITEAIKILRND